MEYEPQKVFEVSEEQLFRQQKTKTKNIDDVAIKTNICDSGNHNIPGSH